MTREARIKTIITKETTPSLLIVENESHQHNVPENSETHFKVVAVSTVFNGLSRIKRHQLIYGLLDHELNSGLHALTLQLHTPEEWAAIHETIRQSPQCHGGSKHG